MSAIKAGYEYLLAYKLTVPIYDYTVVFCRRYIPLTSRTRDQMTQAARSGMQNIAEGNKQQSLQGYIKLAGVARGSLEELRNDYLTFGRQEQLSIWTADQSKREIREISIIWEIIRSTPTLPDHPNFPYLPTNRAVAVNFLITLINQSNYFLDKLIASLKDKHMKEGGFNENLFKKRIEYRRKQY